MSSPPASKPGYYGTKPDDSSPFCTIAQRSEVNIEVRLQWAEAALVAGHDVNQLDLDLCSGRSLNRPLFAALEYNGQGDLVTLVSWLLEHGADPRLRGCRNRLSAIDIVEMELRASPHRWGHMRAKWMMQAAAKKLDDKEAMNRGESPKGWVSYTKWYMGVHPDMPTKGTVLEVQEIENTNPALDVELQAECKFCRERQRHNWHYFCHKGTDEEARGRKGDNGCYFQDGPKPSGDAPPALVAEA